VALHSLCIPNAESLALHYAAWTGAGDAVRELLSKGSDPGAQNAQGFTALHLAVFNMHADVAVDILIRAAPTTVYVKSRKGITALRQSIWNDDVGVMNRLWLAGATVVRRGGDAAALRCVALSGNLNVMTELMRRSGDLSLTASEKDGATATHFAAICGDSALISFFRTEGIDISLACRDHEGRRYANSLGRLLWAFDDTEYVCRKCGRCTSPR